MYEEPDFEVTDEALQRIKEIVIDRLGIPRPDQAAHIAKLQNELLPLFLKLARVSTMMSTAYPVISTADLGENKPLHATLSGWMIEAGNKVDALNAALFDLGIHSALDAVA